MKAWLLAVIAVSVLMSVLIALLPDGTLKKSAITGIGFVYLLALLSPLLGLSGNFMPENLLKDVLREFAWENDTETEEASYMQKVTETYKKRIETECEARLAELVGYACRVTVTVEEDAKAENYGAVKHVLCTVTKDAENQEDIVKPIAGIDKIVVDFRGIHTEGETDTTEEALAAKDRETAADVKKKLVSLLGIGEAAVNVVFQ